MNGRPLGASRAARSLPAVRGIVAAVYLLREDGAALLQLRDDKPEIPHANTWVPPGGHCEPGEPIEECARREFAEETDYRLGAIEELVRFVDDNVAGFEPLDLTVYWATYDGMQEVQCREGQEIAFVPRAEAEDVGIPAYLVELWDRALARMPEAGANERDEVILSATLRSSDRVSDL